jgi:hypothetical protein
MSQEKKDLAAQLQLVTEIEALRGQMLSRREGTG